MSEPCGCASSTFFVRGLTVRMAASAKHLHLTLELRSSLRPSFEYRAKLCVPVCQGGDIVARPSTVLRAQCLPRLCVPGCLAARRSAAEDVKIGTSSQQRCSCPSPGTMRATQNLQIAQHLRLERIRGRGCAIKALQMSGAEGPTDFLHIDCAMSAPRFL
jgi:hypothetical protein